MADRDAVWQPEKQRVQLGRHTYDRTGEDGQVDVSAGDRLCAVLPRGGSRNKRRPIKVKKHGRPAQSLFRAGLDRLVSVLFRGMRLLEILGGEVMDLLAVKEDVG